MNPLFDKTVIVAVAPYGWQQSDRLPDGTPFAFAGCTDEMLADGAHALPAVASRVARALAEQIANTDPMRDLRDPHSRDDKDGEGLYGEAREGLGINRWLHFTDAELVEIQSKSLWASEFNANVIAARLADEVAAELERRRSDG